VAVAVSIACDAMQFGKEITIKLYVADANL
jgi:hypothetical protein